MEAGKVRGLAPWGQSRTMAFRRSPMATLRRRNGGRDFARGRALNSVRSDGRDYIEVGLARLYGAATRHEDDVAEIVRVLERASRELPGRSIDAIVARNGSEVLVDNRRCQATGCGNVITARRVNTDYVIDARRN